jgi:spore maturation protein CgeB
MAAASLSCAAKLRFGARVCVPVYNALDPDTHFPVQADSRFEGHLGFLGNRLPDREARVTEFFFGAAERLHTYTFVLSGSGWADRPRPDNVSYVGHVYIRDHNVFNRSTMAVLNVSRDSMARNGFSPATRVFECRGGRMPDYRPVGGDRAVSRAGRGAVCGRWRRGRGRARGTHGNARAGDRRGCARPC